MATRGGARPGGGRPKKSVELREIQSFAELLPEAQEKIREIMRGSNKTLAFYAAKLVIDKCIPDDHHVVTKFEGVDTDTLTEQIAQGFIALIGNVKGIGDAREGEPGGALPDQREV